jgi:amino acid permease
MDINATRRIVPLLYAILVVVGFLIGNGVGVVVAVVGAMLCALFWATTGRMVNPASGEGPRGDRATARAARRAGRR